MRLGATILLAGLLLVPAFGLPGAQAATASFSWGSDLSQWWSYDPAQRGPALSTASSTGMTHVFTDAKDGLGLAGWATTKYRTFTPFAPGDGAVERVVRDAHAKGLKVSARFDIFEDKEAAGAYTRARIGSSIWVDPGCAEVRDAAIAKLRDMLAHSAVDEVNLDHVRYPEAAEAGWGTPLPCTGGTVGKLNGVDRTEIIASFVREAAQAAREARPGVKVSASIFASTMTGAQPYIGQDARKLAPSLDVVMPMAYPSYFSAAAEAAPYKTVYDNTAAGVRMLGASKVRPWVQGFDAYSGRTDLVCQQLKAAADAGASGAFVWWFPTMGTSSGTWAKLADCVPAGTQPAPTPAPAAPAPSSFRATFAPQPGNDWWVNVHVDANQALASVTASVDGGAPVALSKTSWGSWAKSFHVPSGSTVKFRAVSTSGAAVESPAAYVWPSAKPVGETSALHATFKLGGQNRWWVETFVTADKPLTQVTASVDGGAPVVLPKTSWGSYAKSFQVPAGASVVFTAWAGSESVRSPAYRWP